MNIEVVEKEGLRRELTIEVPVEIVDKTYEKIYDDFRRKAKIKGFRPGKVPVNIVRSRFKNEVTAELIDQLVGQYYDKAVQEKKLQPVGDPVLSSVDVDEGKPFKFTVGIEVLPQIDTVKCENLVIEKGETEIPDSEVDHVLEHLRKSHGEIRSVERAAKADDILIGDLDAISGDVDILDTKSVQNQEIDLGSEYTHKGFKDGLAGIKRDETREITIEYPADSHNSKFAGKKVTYKVAVKEIKERILASLDDSFAKQIGQGETLLELRLNIRKQLEVDRRSDHLRSNKKKIVDQIVGQNAIEVPQGMLDSYLKNVIDDLRQNAKDLNEEEARKQYHPVGINAIRWFLLFHELAKQEKIEVSTEDTENWIKRFAVNYRMEIPKAKELLSKTGKVAEIRDGILEDKVIEFLMSKAEAK